MKLNTYLVLRAACSTARKLYITLWVEHSPGETTSDESRKDWAQAIQDLNDAEIRLKAFMDPNQGGKG